MFFFVHSEKYQNCHEQKDMWNNEIVFMYRNEILGDLQGHWRKTLGVKFFT